MGSMIKLMIFVVKFFKFLIKAQNYYLKPIIYGFYRYALFNSYMSQKFFYHIKYKNFKSLENNTI